MANFQSPFASTALRRSPTADEKANGFPCGAADITLFNGLFYRLESELGHLIQYAGLTGTDTDYTQVRQAVQSLINAATGGGEETEYILLSQAASRVPIFPEMLTGDGRLILTQPAVGTVRMPGGINFLHRGLVPYTTEQMDFATAANKTYHLRWSPSNGYELKDVADPAYNPGSLNEWDSVFDSTYDSMLIARVVTNSNNQATFANLSNKASMRQRIVRPMGGIRYDTTGDGKVPYVTSHPGVNWGRTPEIFLQSFDSHINFSNQAVEKITLETNRYVATISTSAYDNSVVTNGAANFIELGVTAVISAR